MVLRGIAMVFTRCFSNTKSEATKRYGSGLRATAKKGREAQIDLPLFAILFMLRILLCRD
jgi:hypothetical protein